MDADTKILDEAAEEAFRFEVSDEEMEVAAQEMARSYTHQTSASRRCCR